MLSPALFRHCLFISCLALAAATTSIVHAAPAPEVEAAPAKRFTLEVRSGQIIENGKAIGPATVGSILEYLKKQNHDFSLALSPGTANVPVGDLLLQMKNFDLKDVCRAIAIAATEPPLEFDINVEQTLAKLSMQPQPRQVAVFNLSSYLNPDGKADEKTISAKLNTLTDIILRTMRDATSTGGKDDPTFQFHAGANLLVVTGNEVAIDIATKVVNALTRPTASTAIQGGFIPQDATNPDPSKWLYTSWDDSKVTNQSVSAQNYTKLQQMQDALKRLQMQQNNLTSDKTKELQQRIEEVNKQMMNLDQQMKAIQNNNALMTPGGTTSGASGSTPGTR